MYLSPLLIYDSPLLVRVLFQECLQGAQRFQSGKWGHSPGFLGTSSTILASTSKRRTEPCLFWVLLAIRRQELCAERIALGSNNWNFLTVICIGNALGNFWLQQTSSRRKMSDEGFNTYIYRRDLSAELSSWVLLSLLQFELVRQIS